MPTVPSERPAAKAIAKVFKDEVRLFTLITNTLAKDKEISDRWRGFKDVADSRHLANRVEAPVVDALVSRVRAAYPRLSHRYYALKAQAGWAWSGSHTGIATRRCPRSRSASSPGPRRETIVLDGLRRASRRRWPTSRRSFFDERLDRCAGAAGQGAGRLRASDRAVGASLCADELPGQGARRDDAGARAGPWRAPDAGGASRARCWRRRR